MRCNRDCFNCIHDDCILGTKGSNQRDRKAYQHNYYIQNRERLLGRANERSAALRANKKMDRQGKCHFCGKEWDTPRDILKYKNHYYCDDECLGQYLVSKIEDEVETVWHDTKENMRICALEEKHADNYL